MLVEVGYLFQDEGPYHIEPSPSICSANQWTGFSMIKPFAMKELIVIHRFPGFFSKFFRLFSILLLVIFSNFFNKDLLRVCFSVIYPKCFKKVFQQDKYQRLDRIIKSLCEKSSQIIKRLDKI